MLFWVIIKDEGVPRQLADRALPSLREAFMATKLPITIGTHLFLSPFGGGQEEDSQNLFMIHEQSKDILSTTD